MPFLLNFKEKQLKKNEEGFHIYFHKQKIPNYSPPQALLTPRRHKEIALIKSKKRTSPGM